MVSALVICIGNVARRDDGVAHRVAELVEQHHLPDVRILTAVGLDVAMAEDVAGARRVFLVDADRRQDPAVRVTPLKPGKPTAPTGHSIDAPSLLLLAGTLYDATPPAWLVSVAAPDMSHGEGLSETAEAASTEAASVLISLIGERGTQDTNDRH